MSKLSSENEAKVLRLPPVDDSRKKKFKKIKGGLSDHKDFKEAETLKRKSPKCFFYFLESLTCNGLTNKAKARYRKLEEKYDKLWIQLIPDEVLEKIYLKVCSDYQREQTLIHEYTGFSQTGSEKQALKTINTIFQSSANFKNVRTIPSLRQSRKMIIGGHIPDIILLGLTESGRGLIIIEIDGESHDRKTRKDTHYYEQMEKLGFFVYSIPNDRATDKAFIEALFTRFKPVHGKELAEKEKRALRRIWCYTIASLCSIEALKSYLAECDINMNLGFILAELGKLPECPARIKAEAKANEIPPTTIFTRLKATKGLNGSFTREEVELAIDRKIHPKRGLQKLKKLLKAHDGYDAKVICVDGVPRLFVGQIVDDKTIKRLDKKVT